MKGKERAELRAEAHHLDPMVHVGAAGATDAVIQTIDTKIAALKAHASQLGDWDPTEMMHEWARRSAYTNPMKPEESGPHAEAFKYMHLR